MAKVNLARTARKALLRGAQYAGVAITALVAVPVPEDVGVSEQAAIVFGLGALGAVAKAIQNYHKTKKRKVQLGSTSGYMLVLIALSLALAGCVTTTAPDGTVTQSVDLTTAWEVYERYEALERERDAADAADRARIDAELRRLEPELREATRRLGL